MNDFLARAVLHKFGFCVAQVHRLAKQPHGLAQRSRRLGFHQRAKFRSSFIHGIRTKRHRHALPRPHRVDRERERGDLPINCRLFDEQGLAAAGRFHFAVSEFGDFEFGGDGLRNTLQFAGEFQRIQKITKGIESHALETSKKVWLRNVSKSRKTRELHAKCARMTHS